jgi:hypothetical protein
MASPPSPFRVFNPYMPSPARDLAAGDTFRFPPRPRVVWLGEQSVSPRRSPS